MVIPSGTMNITHFHNELIKWLKNKPEHLSDNLLAKNHFQAWRTTLRHDNALILSTTIFVCLHTPISADLSQHCLTRKSHTLALGTE